MKVDLTQVQIREISDILKNGCHGYRKGDFRTHRGRILKKIYENIKEREAYNSIRNGRLPTVK